MTWEQTIESIRKKADYKDLVRDAYFDSDLVANVERFANGPEWKETLLLIRKYAQPGARIADIGSGNGISTIAFGLENYNVISIEPDPSDTIGAGAIQKLIEHYYLSERVSVRQRYGEDTGIHDQSLDVVYIRQAMHHAHNLGSMIKECYRILRPGGILLTIRDHIIFDGKDKEWFLESHPLHKFYGGENAYTEDEYKHAMTNAGFRIEKVLRYYDSIINYFPLSKKEVEEMAIQKEKKFINSLRKKIGPLVNVGFIVNLLKKYYKFDRNQAYDERRIPGRMYTFLAVKP